MACDKNIISVARNVGLTLGLTLGLAACSTVQENPTSNGATTTAATYTPASSQSYSSQPSYQTATSQAAEARCRNKESNREIIGGAAGGALGAFAGKKLIGGTAGTIAGAAIGGTAGYGLGDISVDCSPQQSYQPAQVQTYQSAPAPVYQAAPATYTQPASVQTVSTHPVYTQPIHTPTVIQTAPTDAQYAGQVVSGTPGYAATQGSEVQTIRETTQYQNASPHLGNVHNGIQTSAVQTRSVYNGNGASEITGYDYSDNLISADTAINAQNGFGTQTRVLGSQTGALQSYTVQPGDTVYGLSRKLCVGISDIQSPNNINANYGINIGQSLRLPQSRC